MVPLMAEDGLGMPLAAALRDLRRRAFPDSRTLSDLVANAGWWVASCTPYHSPTDLALPHDQLVVDEIRLREPTYVASLGFVNAAKPGSISATPAILESLARISRRAPTTPERDGLADDPLRTIGLFLLAREVSNESAPVFKSLLHRIANERNDDLVTLFLLGTADRPLLTTLSRTYIPKTATQYAVATLSEEIDDRLATALFGKDPETFTNASKTLVAEVCRSELASQTPLEVLLIIIAVELLIARGAHRRIGAATALSATKLGGAEIRHIVQALLDAFPRVDDLEKMLRYGLDKKLLQIAHGTTYESQVFHLVELAEAENWVPALVRAAHTHNPQNESLVNLLNQLQR